MDAMAKAAGIPLKRVLLRVVPAVQTQTVGDTQLTVVSLELYDDAFVAHVRLRDLAERRSDNPFLTIRGWPQLSFDGSDDTGQNYNGYQGAGGGSDSEFRFEIVFTPAVADDARALTLVASEVRWTAHMAGQRSRAEPGSWQFEIALT